MKILNIYSIATFSVLFLTLYACDSSGVVEDSKASAESFSPKILSVGQIHNDALSHLQESFISQIDEPISRQIFDDSLVNISVNYLSQGFTDVNVDSIFSQFYPTILNQATFSNQLDYELNELFLIIDSAIDSTNLQAGQYIYDISRIILQNPPEFVDETDLNAYLYAVDVMGYSAIFWYNNIDDWEEGIANSQGLTIEESADCRWLCRLWRRIRGTVRADVRGAAAGAVTGAFSGPGALAGAA
ncbi:MAG: hypothetical protein RQ756_02420, partial [Flavobacteriaceae bacterium]|nr:hypothetical protein [Flavobacteriaceae bacterium]